MNKRGRILRDTNAGPGLVTADGKQYSFTLEDMWASDIPPRPGMLVEITFNEEGVPLSLHAVPENQIVKEQAQQALAGARTQGTALATTLKARFGTPLLIAAAVLIVGWFLLNSVSMGGSRVQLTFWQTLGYIGSAQAMMHSLDSTEAPGTGIYSLLGVIALAAPFARFFWRDRRASLGGWFPLLLMILVAFEVHSGLEHVFETVYGGPNSGPQRDHAWQMFMNNINVTLGIGAYVSLAASLYFAWIGTRQFLVNRATLPNAELQQAETAA